MRWIATISEFFRDNYPSSERLGEPVERWRQSIYRTVFEQHTKMGKRFEQWLLLAIVLSLCVVMAHSISAIAQNSALYYGLRALEWMFTLVFTAEYALRLVSVRHPLRYALSFYGVVDLLSIVPTYLSIFYPEAHFLASVRALRLVRTFHLFPVFRHFLNEYQMLGHALRASARKIFVFLSVVALIVFVMGTLIFVIEGPEHGFTSVPMGIYWAISTVTTVGYGDVTPSSTIGRIFASIMMMLGWGVLAVPTGIVGAELSRNAGAKPSYQGIDCARCGLQQHAHEARYCCRCGMRLELPLKQPATQAPSRAAAARGSEVAAAAPVSAAPVAAAHAHEPAAQAVGNAADQAKY